MGDMDIEEDETRVLVRFKSDTGEEVENLIDIPITVNTEQLTDICNNLLKEAEPVPFVFSVNNIELTKTLEAVLESDKLNTENVVEIVYHRQSIFRVQAITRCTSSMPGHAEAVISVKFSPNGQYLASGSGDTTVRLWDIFTQTPEFTCSGHKNWVLVIAWSPDSESLISGCKNGEMFHWASNSGKQKGSKMVGHKQWITDISWEPFHANIECRNFASSSKDGDIRLWDSRLNKCYRILTSHTRSISAVIWGGHGLIYSSSQDRTIKVWRAADGVMCRTLQGHGHWVNTLALSTNYILKSGTSFESNDTKGVSKTELQTQIKAQYDKLCGSDGEFLISGSDDFTMFLWNPEHSNKCIARLTGHQQLINDVKFSPDIRFIASASFDKSVKLWNGKTGQFLETLRGHVKAVYMLAWSGDSRLLVSASSDSTLKVWCMKAKKLLHDLPGHLDEVYAVDWSFDGYKVASGGKDKVLKLWQR